MAAQPPDADGRWLRPSRSVPAEPRWGHATGLQVGLHPLRGPRGLLRVFAPYLDHPRDRLVNFVAIEPIPAGATERGYSELEHSRLDNAPGKRFWSTDDLEDAAPQPPEHPARGVLETVDGVEHLRVFVQVEPFDNGASVVVRLSFRADRPHEVGLAMWRRENSAPLDYCVATATMGNFARLRRLQLADRVVMPDELWPDYAGEHFAPHARFGLAELTRDEHGDAVVRATPDELAPQLAEYAPGTAEHWKYVGRRARQTWRAPAPDPRLEALVNGRRVYWASTTPIPGGMSYENVELLEPFRPGREFVFGIDPIG